MNPGGYNKIFAKENCKFGSGLPRCRATRIILSVTRSTVSLRWRNKPLLRRITDILGNETSKQFLTGNFEVCSKPVLFILKNKNKWITLFFKVKFIFKMQRNKIDQKTALAEGEFEDKGSMLCAGRQSNPQPRSPNSSAGLTRHCMSHCFQTLPEGRSPLEGLLST